MWDAPWHWIVLAVLVIALFGYKKLPEASRALGRSLRIFKTEIKGMSEDDRARDDAGTTVAQAPAPAPAVPPASVVDAPTTATAANGAGTAAAGSDGDASAVNGSAVNGSAPAAPAAAATPAGDGPRSTEK